MLYIDTEQVTSESGKVIDIQTIYMHRNNHGVILYTVETETGEKRIFKPGDIVEFIVFEKKGYTKVPLLYKEIKVEEECEYVKIFLTSEDTKLGKKANKPVTCWYEIRLNGNTINGYDYDEGASNFIVLPAKDGEVDE